MPRARAEWCGASVLYKSELGTRNSEEARTRTRFGARAAADLFTPRSRGYEGAGETERRHPTLGDTRTLRRPDTRTLHAPLLRTLDDNQPPPEHKQTVRTQIGREWSTAFPAPGLHSHSPSRYHPGSHGPGIIPASSPHALGICSRHHPHMLSASAPGIIPACSRYSSEVSSRLAWWLATLNPIPTPFSILVPARMVAGHPHSNRGPASCRSGDAPSEAGASRRRRRAARVPHEAVVESSVSWVARHTLLWAHALSCGSSSHAQALRRAHARRDT